ncbi:allophanate hydrolase [Coraliomargarita parva]|uniref:allophanate hydrolase n=1 Tax=Coraliomargarita parva TaxID=3014050 RepID=UPI0022B323E7|nr:allophanate hydrolase [Coraliomargarita parva]
MTSTCSLDIGTLRKAYLCGALNPRELMRCIRTRIEDVANPGIWIHQLSEAELEPYLEKLEGSDPKDLPLYGIPFAIKDNIDLAGVPTTAACPAYAYTPEESAPVVENLIQAGAIPVGKTNLDQFATGLVGVRSPYPIPRNPIAPDRVPGGSSSGSAVSLSEGLVSFSLGTDTAGSGRVPAAFNKLWGLKPSCGRLSTNGVVPACRTLDCVSIFAWNAADCSSVLKAAEGYDVSDPYSRPLKSESLPQTNKLGVPRPEQLMFFGDAGYESAWLKRLEALKAKGWELVEVDFEPFLSAARLLYEGPWVSERYTALEEFLKTNADDFFPATRTIIAGGADHSARDAFAAAYKLAALKRESEARWEGVTAIVTPTAGGFPTLAEMDADPIGPNSKLGYYTNFMNLFDLCAVATPAGESESGLPFGITWIAPRDRDAALLKIAAEGPGDGPLGTTDPTIGTISILLFGAHMSGLPLNSQVIELGGKLLGEVKTAAKYRMVYLPEPAPHRPGIYRVDSDGSTIAAEEWCFPKASLGQFLATIHQPLGLGEIELEDGRKVHGFLCEATVGQQAEDISGYRSWRGFLQNR